MDFLTSKKAVSPLIAAVLLIVVVVGIGAVVTGIVRNYVTENKQTITEKASDMKCGVEVAITVPSVNDVLKICNATSTSINFTLENTGTATIDEIQVKFFGSSSFAAIDTLGASGSGGLFGSGMAPGKTLSFNASFPSSIGTLQQIKIVPRVKVVGRAEKAFCTDAALTFTEWSATC
jgi:FlaG/FlaF family flagellin (archaellin)